MEESTSTSFTSKKAPKGPDTSTREKPRSSRWKRFGRAVLKGLGRGLEVLGKMVLGVGEVVLGVGWVLAGLKAGVALAAVAVPTVLAASLAVPTVLGVAVSALPVLVILSPIIFVFLAHYYGQ